MEKIRIYNENGEDTGRVVTRGEYKPADGEFVLAAVMIVRIGEKVLITKRDKINRLQECGSSQEVQFMLMRTVKQQE